MKLLAVDIGGTFIKYGCYDCETNQLGSVGKVETPTTNQEDLIDTITTISKAFPDMRGCAISMPGTIDYENGYIYQGGALQYNNRTAFADILSKHLNMPVTIENDARCAAQAEMWQGNLQGVQNALVIVIGTGLGCGIVQDGRIYRGTHRYAGELSLVFTKDINEYGAEAVLGNQVGIPNFVAKLSEISGEELDGPLAFSKIESGNEKLTQLFEQYIENFSTQLFNFQLMFDPEKILIGGGISKNKFYMKKLSKSVEAFYEKLPLYINHAPIETCKFESEANLIGAVKNFIELQKCVV